MKQWEMANVSLETHGFDFSFDVRDKDRLYRALTNIDYVVRSGY